MEAIFNRIPPKIQPHLIKLMKATGIPENEESAEKVVNNWLEKKKIFEDKTNELGMKEVNTIGKEDKRACMAMTYSGSLVNIGPVKEGLRRTTYASIGLRGDVPDLFSSDQSILGEDIKIDSSIVFSEGPIKNTSAIYRIVLCDEVSLSEEQEKQIENAATEMIDDFIKVNNMILDNGKN